MAEERWFTVPRIKQSVRERREEFGLSEQVVLTATGRPARARDSAAKARAAAPRKRPAHRLTGGSSVPKGASQQLNLGHH